MTTEPNMLPCPHCGSMQITARENGAYGIHSKWWMECDDCDARGPASLNRESALSAWNKRASAGDGEEVLAALTAVNKLIAEAAMTGFNWKDGDWAERLFNSQQATSRAIKNAESAPARQLIASAGGEIELGRFGHHPDPAIEACAKIADRYSSIGIFIAQEIRALPSPAAITRAAPESPANGDGAAITLSPSGFHAALTATGKEYAAYSCNGINLYGDRQSIKAAGDAFHSHGIIDQLRTNLRHWRDECGKLQAKLSAAPSISKRSE